jgi:hypothetical protein
MDSSCPYDLDGSGYVDGGDLVVLLHIWGDFGVGIWHLIGLLMHWGPCGDS